MIDNYMLTYLAIVMMSIISALLYIFYLSRKITIKQVGISMITALILTGGGYLPNGRKLFFSRFF